MVEDPPPYHTGPTDNAEPFLTTEDLVAQAHANRQGIPAKTGAQQLQWLPERLRALADRISSGNARAEDMAYAIAARIDRIEPVPVPARKGH